MPIEDIPFYTVMGEEISRNILVEKMIQYYQLKLKANETQITDFNDGSEWFIHDDWNHNDDFSGSRSCLIK